jgi:hypothetical protein
MNIQYSIRTYIVHILKKCSVVFFHVAGHFINVYRQESNFGFIPLSKSQNKYVDINPLKKMAIDPVQCMNNQMRGAILGTGPICVQVDHPDPPSPLSHNWFLGKTAPSSSPFAAMVTVSPSARLYVWRILV